MLGWGSATLKHKSEIATTLFPFTDTLMITFKPKIRFWQVILTGPSFRYTRTLTNTKLWRLLLRPILNFNVVQTKAEKSNHYRWYIRYMRHKWKALCINKLFKKILLAIYKFWYIITSIYRDYTFKTYIIHGLHDEEQHTYRIKATRFKYNCFKCLLTTLERAWNPGTGVTRDNMFLLLYSSHLVNYRI